MDEHGSRMPANLKGTPLEVVRAVWACALGVDAVADHVGFFDLGATSVVVVDVLRQLRPRWPHLTAVDLFDHPTVVELADHLDDHVSS